MTGIKDLLEFSESAFDAISKRLRKEDPFKASEVKNQNDLVMDIYEDLRKDLKNIELDFNYDFNENKISFDNLRIDNKTNEKLDRLISKFNASEEKFFNKITFKTFVNKVFNAYFG